MAKHYYDFEIDDCPIHEDKDTDQFFRLELILPIGLDKPHAGWKSSEQWTNKFLIDINDILPKDIQKVLKYRMGIGHVGITDNKTCYKYIGKEEEK